MLSVTLPVGPRLRLAGVAVAAALCLLALPASLAAQEAARDSAPPVGIDGFRSLRWGTDSAGIVAERGAPVTVRAVPSLGARALVYARDTLGRTVGSTGYVLFPDSGLVRVLYLTEYGEGGSCLTVYQHLRDTLASMYGRLAYRERLHNEAEDLDFCTAFQLGRAGGRTVWRDPTTGARAWIALDLEAGVVRVSVESPTFVSRLRRTGGG